MRQLQLKPMRTLACSTLSSWTKLRSSAARAGAPSAMQFCLRDPERCSAMVLAVPLAYSDTQGAPAQRPSRIREFVINTTLRSDFIFWAMSKLARETIIKTILATPPKDVETATADEQVRVEQVLEHIAPISRREQGLRNDATIARSLSRYDLEGFNIPTLVMSVEDDLFNTYDNVVNFVDRANIRVIECRGGAGLSPESL
jgi:2-hydroxy-6-oxonona-2,4-dienedioate hydrolase